MYPGKPTSNFSKAAIMINDIDIKYTGRGRFKTPHLNMNYAKAPREGRSSAACFSLDIEVGYAAGR
jgi:hypothetical protein